MIVKVCGITNRMDAEVSVEAGATAIGFNFYRDSLRYISPTGAAMIGEKLDCTKVGIFVNETAANIAKIMLEADLDVAQLHGTSRAVGFRVWRAAQIDDMPEYPSVEAFLLDTPSERLHGGTGETFDWSSAAGLPFNIILAGGLDAGNVAKAIRQGAPCGVDACSRLESSPGVKDHEKVRRFVKAALEVAASLNL